jgi:hypothetical protein
MLSEKLAAFGRPQCARSQTPTNWVEVGQEAHLVESYQRRDLKETWDTQESRFLSRSRTSLTVNSVVARSAWQPHFPVSICLFDSSKSFYLTLPATMAH